jgi:hypothetical protein
MDTENSKKLFIIQPSVYQYESFEPLLAQVEGHFKRILSFLKVSTPSGKSTDMKLTVDVFNPEKISAYAKRITKDPAVYEIRMNAGLSYCIWTASRTFAIPEYDILSWLDECNINDERLKKLSKKEVIADYAFFLGIYYIILHEISHVILGHLDYLNDEMNLNHLSEFQDEKREYSAEEIKIRKSLEAEADRQAGELMMIFFENSLGENGLGGYLLFPSRIHAYEFYVYAITAVFRIFQDLTERKGVIHPKPNERLYIMVSALSKYFSQNLTDQHDEIYLHAVKSCLEAGKKFLVIDSFEPLTVMLNAHNLSFVDDVIREINIRQYQHQIEVTDTG